MEDSVLWAIALGAGVLGLLLLAVAVVVAIYVNIKARGAGETASADRPYSRAEAVGSLEPTEASEQQAGASGAERTSVGNFWVWIKAWVFATVHAGVVSLVLGAITFFEDIAKAGDEIENTGTVTFPKQLLPGSLAGSVSRKRLAQPAEPDNLEDPDPPDAPASEAAAWEVVDLLDEADVKGNH